MPLISIREHGAHHAGSVVSIDGQEYAINIADPFNAKEEGQLEWYFEQPGTGSGWESMQQSMAFSDEIQHEDIEICETVQRGLKSRSYDQGRFSVKRENGVHHFQSLVHRALVAL